MNVSWVLARKEVLEQRQTWKFLAMAGLFVALALLISMLPFIVREVVGEPGGPEEARKPESTDGRREDRGRG